MKLIFCRFEDGTTFLSENLEFDFPALEKLSAKKLFLEKEKVSKGDLILFYKTFSQKDTALFDMVFAYFEVGRIKDGVIQPAKKLSFDETRKGAGSLTYSRRRVLTRYSSPVNHWSLPEFFKCMNITSATSSLNSRFREDGGVRYFENTTRTFSLCPIPSRDSLVYFENALLEWTSSLLEEIRGECTRRFNAMKKGETGQGKTGFVKYSYRPDRRRAFYCRTSHTVGKKPREKCASCSLYKRGACEWSLPDYNGRPYIPLSTADAFAYFDVLLEKGLVMDYRDE